MDHSPPRDLPDFNQVKLTRIRSHLVQSLNEPIQKQIADHILGNNIIKDEETSTIFKENLSEENQARTLIDIVRKKGEEACTFFLNILKEWDIVTFENVMGTGGNKKRPAYDEPDLKIKRRKSSADERTRKPNLGGYALSDMEKYVESMQNELVEKLKEKLGEDAVEELKEKIKFRSLKKHMVFTSEQAHHTFSSKRMKDYIDYRRKFPSKEAIAILFEGPKKTSTRRSSKGQSLINEEEPLQECEQTYTETQDATDEINDCLKSTESHQIREEEPSQELESIGLVKQNDSEEESFCRKSNGQCQINDVTPSQEPEQKISESQNDSGWQLDRQHQVGDMKSLQDPELRDLESLEANRGIDAILNQSGSSAEGISQLGNSSVVECTEAENSSEGWDAFSSLLSSFSESCPKGRPKQERKTWREKDRVTTGTEMAKAIEAWLEEKVCFLLEKGKEQMTPTELKSFLKSSMKFVNQRQHNDYRCLKAHHCIVVKVPLTENLHCHQCILDIQLPKNLDLVESGCSTEKSDAWFPKALTRASNFTEAFKSKLQYNMAILGDISSTDVYFYKSKNPLETVLYDHDKFINFAKHFEKCVSEIFLPLLAVYKEMQKERRAF